MIPKTYECPNCGASIGYQGRCEYCGSVLDWIPTTGVKYVSMREDTTDLHTEARIPMDIIKSGKLSLETVKAWLLQELTPQLMPFLTVQQKFDIRDLSYCYRASIKVVKEVKENGSKVL